MAACNAVVSCTCSQLMMLAISIISTAGVDAGSGPVHMVHMECCDVSMTALLQQQLLLGCVLERSVCISKRP